MLVEIFEVDPKTEDEIEFSKYEFTPSEDYPQLTSVHAFYIIQQLDLTLETDFSRKYIVKCDNVRIEFLPNPKWTNFNKKEFMNVVQR